MIIFDTLKSESLILNDTIKFKYNISIDNIIVYLIIYSKIVFINDFHDDYYLRVYHCKNVVLQKYLFF